MERVTGFYWECVKRARVRVRGGSLHCIRPKLKVRHTTEAMFHRSRHHLKMVQSSLSIKYGAMVYLSLFFTALIAATLFPLSSEALLITLLYQQTAPWMLWLAATSGNTLGSCINWYLGKQCLRWQNKKWFPFKAKQLHRAQQQFQHYGEYSLLLAWLPIIGDPLTFVAGVMRISFWKFVVLVALGKSLRYAVVIFLALRALN